MATLPSTPSQMSERAMKISAITDVGKKSAAAASTTPRTVSAFGVIRRAQSTLANGYEMLSHPLTIPVMGASR